MSLRSSPRRQGTCSMWSSSNFSVRIIPADAGSTRWNAENPSSGADYPRRYGEHGDLGHQLLVRGGSSPRIRGAPEAVHHMQVAIRIIPADTGSTPSWIRRPWPARDHPRRCGEHSKRPRKRSTRRGSSPRMRRAPRLHGHRMMSGRIIPADAGSTRHRVHQRDQKRDHPRGCGEHPWGAIGGTVPLGSSPRMRGAQHAGGKNTFNVRIIPADAGSTATSPARQNNTQDHPRGCGEHDLLAGLPAFLLGSSPRMRGAQKSIVRQPEIRRIIPANAGSTGQTKCRFS